MYSSSGLHQIDFQNREQKPKMSQMTPLGRDVSLLPTEQESPQVIVFLVYSSSHASTCRNLRWGRRRGTGTGGQTSSGVCWPSQRGRGKHFQPTSGSRSFGPLEIWLTNSCIQQRCWGSCLCCEVEGKGEKLLKIHAAYVLIMLIQDEWIASHQTETDTWKRFMDIYR